MPRHNSFAFILIIVLSSKRFSGLGLELFLQFLPQKHHTNSNHNNHMKEG